MVPDKNRAVFIRTSGGIPPCSFLWTMFFSFCTLWFLSRPCFSLQSPCGFYSDRVFSKCYIKSATVISTLRLFIPLWFLSGPRFSGSVLCGFYKEWGFYFLPPVVFIQAMVLQSLPMTFLFCPCAQSSTIEYASGCRRQIKKVEKGFLFTFWQCSCSGLNYATCSSTGVWFLPQWFGVLTSARAPGDPGSRFWPCFFWIDPAQPWRPQMLHCSPWEGEA